MVSCDIKPVTKYFGTLVSIHTTIIHSSHLVNSFKSDDSACMLITKLTVETFRSDLL